MDKSKVKFEIGDFVKCKKTSLEGVVLGYLDKKYNYGAQVFVKVTSPGFKGHDTCQFDLIDRDRPTEEEIEGKGYFFLDFNLVRETKILEEDGDY